MRLKRYAYDVCERHLNQGCPTGGSKQMLIGRRKITQSKIFTQDISKVLLQNMRVNFTQNES